MLDNLNTDELSAMERQMPDDELSRLRETNEQLASENTALREKSHELSTGLRLIGYLGVCVAAYFVMQHSMLAAGAMAAAAFYFCFMR